MKVPAITVPIGTSRKPMTASVAGAESAHPVAPFRRQKRLAVMMIGLLPEDLAPGVEPVALGCVELFVVEALERRNHLGPIGPAGSLLGLQLHGGRDGSIDTPLGQGLLDLGIKDEVDELVRELRVRGAL